jgi:hypothetical protein
MPDIDAIVRRVEVDARLNGLPPDPDCSPRERHAIHESIREDIEAICVREGVEVEGAVERLHHLMLHDDQFRRESGDRIKEKLGVRRVPMVNDVPRDSRGYAAMVCSAKNCNNVGRDPENPIIVPGFVPVRRWWCPAHRDTEERRRDMEPFDRHTESVASLRLSASGAIVAQRSAPERQREAIREEHRRRDEEAVRRLRAEEQAERVAMEEANRRREVAEFARTLGIEP